MVRSRLKIGTAAAALALAAAGVRASTITLGPTTLTNAGSLDGWSSNQFTIEGTDSHGDVYSYTNTTGATQTITPTNFSWYSGTTATTHIITPYIALINNTNLEASGSQTILAIGNTQLNPGSGLQSATFGGTGAFTLAPGASMAIGFIDANANGTGNTGSVVSFSSTTFTGGESWYNGGSGANSYNGRAPTSVGNTIGGASTAVVSRNYQFNITMTATPEPASIGLLGVGSLALLRRRRA